MSFEIKHTIKHNFRLKLGKSWAYWASTQFTRMLIQKGCNLNATIETKIFCLNCIKLKNRDLLINWNEFFCLHSNIQESIGSCSIENIFFLAVLKLDVKDSFGYNKKMKKHGKNLPYNINIYKYCYYLACILEGTWKWKSQHYAAVLHGWYLLNLTEFI